MCIMRALTKGQTFAVFVKPIVKEAKQTAQWDSTLQDHLLNDHT